VASPPPLRDHACMRSLLLALTCLAGCADAPATPTTAASTSDTLMTLGMSSATDVTGEPTQGRGTTTTTLDATTLDTTTLDTTTHGPGEHCGPTFQDCIEGLKCTAYAKEEGDTWNANKCVPVTGDGLAGDPCTVTGPDRYTGIDDCAKGFICIAAADDMQMGFCVAFCGSVDACDDGGLCTGNGGDGTLPICLMTCDPLAPDCPGDQACYGDPSGPPFICFDPDPQANDGQAGDPCEFTNACLGGLHCAESASQDGCAPDTYGCCTEFCPLDAPACTAPETCVPFFPEPQPGHENVGLCALPP